MTEANDTQEQRQLREITTPPKLTCPNGCKQRDGATPSPMRATVGQSVRVKRLPDGSTRQATVMVTVRTCDRCGEQVRSETEI